MRIVAIDPGTRNVGVTLWADGRFERDWTLTANGKLPQRAHFVDRVAVLCSELANLMLDYRAGFGVDVILVELAGSFGRGHASQSSLAYATGALVEAARGGDGIEVVPVRPADWCRKKNGRMSTKEAALARLRRRHGHLDEHVLCARAFVDWYLAKLEASQ